MAALRRGALPQIVTFLLNSDSFVLQKKNEGGSSQVIRSEAVVAE